MPGESSSSVRVFSIDRNGVESAVAEWVRTLHERPEVIRVIWFGSWIVGRPTPGSDVDLCVVLTQSDRPFRDRIPEYLPGAFPVGVDLFPFTKSEFDRLATASPELYAAISSGCEV